MKWQNDLMLDAGLNYIKNNVTQVCACNAQPATYADATTTMKLAIRTGLTPGSFTGPVDGDVNGRKITVLAQSGINVDTSGALNHIALCSGTALLYVNTCTAQALTAGNSMNLSAWDIELADVV